MKFINGNIEENLQFQLFEVQSQLERTEKYIVNPSHELLNKILSRDNYIDNLKNNIQRKSFSLATEGKNVGLVDTLNAANTIATNLERIADFCGKIVKQITYIEDENLLKHYDFNHLFAEIITGVSLIKKTIANDDVKIAIKICKIEKAIDEHYAKIFKKVLKELKTSKYTQSLITIIFIARYLERMGDSLLNIGEAIISSLLGDQIKIEQLQVLKKSLKKTDLNQKVSELSLQAMAETKSGCKIDLVSHRQEADISPMVIFKEGKLDKLQQEKEGVDYWDTLIPGIAPNIYAHRKMGDSSALLFEFLDGDSFEKILLSGSDAELSKALSALKSTLSTIWQKTRQEEQKPSNFVKQIRDRLDSIYTIHPGFSSGDIIIGDMTIPSFTSLLDSVENIEKNLTSPFSVLLHGDFNLDNILYDNKTNKIRLVDLHRSTHGDYIQDISVFMISNFRLQVFDARTRNRIKDTISSCYIFSSQIAKEAKDTTFDLRLALGLARSLITSTRFVLDKDIACDMLLRSRHLMEAVARVKPKQYSRFKLPEEVIIV